FDFRLRLFFEHESLLQHECKRPDRTVEALRGDPCGARGRAVSGRIDPAPPAPGRSVTGSVAESCSAASFETGVCMSAWLFAKRKCPLGRPTLLPDPGTGKGLVGRFVTGTAFTRGRRPCGPRCLHNPLMNNAFFTTQSPE